jgi:hypothetical protein
MKLKRIELRKNIQNIRKNRITMNHIIGIVSITMFSIICYGQTEISGNRIEGKVNNLSYYVDVTKGTVSSPE